MFVYIKDIQGHSRLKYETRLPYSNYGCILYRFRDKARYCCDRRWLDVADRVTYKLGVTVYKCLHGQAPDYLSELCTPVAQVDERQHLRSASRHLLVVLRFQLDTYGRRTFAVAGPTTWNLFQTICVSRTCKLTVFVVH